MYSSVSARVAKNTALEELIEHFSQLTIQRVVLTQSGSTCMKTLRSQVLSVAQNKICNWFSMCRNLFYIHLNNIPLFPKRRFVSFVSD